MTAAKSAATAFLARLMLAHFAAYPLAFVAAFAAIAPVIVLREDAIFAVEAQAEPSSSMQRWLMDELQVGASEAAAVEKVLVPSGIVALIVFVLAHASAVPWAVAAKRAVLGGDERAESLRRARAIWLWINLGIAGLVMVAGIVAWLSIATKG
jgi:hypothetical protein